MLKNKSKFTTSIYIESSIDFIWWYIATPEGMNGYLTDKVTTKNGKDCIEAGEQVEIVIGDMINEATCIISEAPHVFRLKDHFRTLFADDTYFDYELTTTFSLYEMDQMTKVVVTVEGYDEQHELMQWLKDCGELGWKQSLFNLKNVLELGLDLRYDIFGYPRLGVCNYTASAQQLKRQGLDHETIQGNVLMEVFSDGPAAKAGLKKGDIVINIGDHTVPTYHAFVKALALSFQQSKHIDMVYYRNRERKETTAVLSEDKKFTGLVTPDDDSIEKIKQRK
ncbi:PDZ domain-containing protein [Longirhabdus pacifica]|uniref:PDZ domain-containing protein n=1 Tax=Longirhabdus pacifica TaxID=2305227 RepID=UPI0013E8D7AC|nr:PDZ domain-containing protein [Longirhabdus pacifica]